MSKGMLGELPLYEVRGPRNDLDEKLAGPQGKRWLRELNKFLRQEACWEVFKNFTVISYGRNKYEFEDLLRKKGFDVNGLVPFFDLLPTTDRKYVLAVIRGRDFSDSDRTTENIRAEAKRRGYLTPPVEVAFLLREMIYGPVGFHHLVVFHKPQPLADNNRKMANLGLTRTGLNIYYPDADGKWSKDKDFLFLKEKSGPASIDEKYDSKKERGEGI